MSNIKNYRDYVSAMESNDNEKSSVTSSDSSNNDYYQMSKQQEYVTLLDKEIELENARSNALKLTNNQLASSGMASQGYGSSQMSGITGRYLSAYENANKEYQDNVNNLKYQQHQEELSNANDRFESITTMMTQASDVDQLNSLLLDYKYGTIDEEGNFQFGEKPEGLSDDDWYQMRYYYKLQKSAIEENNKVEEYAATYGNLDSWYSANYVTNNGSTKNIKDKFKYESNALWANINAGKYSYGTAVMMQNGDGDVIYVQWTQNGLRMVDKETYNSSENKDSLIWKVNVKS